MLQLWGAGMGQSLALPAQGWLLCRKNCRRDGLTHSMKRKNCCLVGQGDGHPVQKDFYVLVMAPEL